VPKAGWTSKRTKAWPEGHRGCNVCGDVKPLEEFCVFPKGARGRYPQCNECRKPISKKQWQQKSYRKKIFDRCKTRATKKGLAFNLTLEDIPEIPTLCPVLLIPMQVPSLDRIDSKKGYVKGNIRIISNRANILKNNATVEELTLVLKDLVAIGVMQDG